MLADKAKRNIIKNFEMAAKEFDFCFISPYYMGDNGEYCAEQGVFYETLKGSWLKL